MSKGSVPSAPAAPPAAAKPTIGGSAVANIQSRASERDVDVLNWGNGEPVSEAPAMAREADPDFRAPARVTPQKGEPDHPDEQVTGKRSEELSDEVAEDPKAAGTPKETPTEKRQRALDSLAAEKRSRTLEAELKTERTRREASEKLTLGEILKARGVNKDDLLEKLLAGSDDLGLPAKLEGADATFAELKARLDAAEAKLTEREKREQERNIQDAVATVAADLKDVGVPLIESLDAYQDVLQEAYDLWTAEGKRGSSRVHIPQAAENIEKRLRAKHPRLAALADAAEKASTPAAAAAALAPRAAVSRRVGARAVSTPAKLPDDVADRDAAIKKEMGWT